MVGESITVIEPNEAQRLLYEWELGDDGYEVTSYASPEDVSAAQDPPMSELVLVDAGRHASVAVERLHKVNHIFPDAAVVAHSASHLVASENPPAPCDAFLLKQSDLTGLKQTIRTLLLNADTPGPG